jgi:SAM-dependent methyltransferase
MLETRGRDYDVYTDLMSDDGVVDVKYDDIEPFIREGTIVGDGCGDGALLERLAERYTDSDVCCVELSNEMAERFRQRKRRNDSREDEVELRQQSVLEDAGLDRVDTVIASSLCHELWSYYEGDATLAEYFAAKHDQLDPGGRLVVRDVIGPDREGEILAWFNCHDGVEEDIYQTFDDDEERKEHLDDLSTDARFRRFLEDFEGRGLESASVTEVERDGMQLYRMDADVFSEYVLTKDYTDNWENEMRESFAFWSADRYEEALEGAGFEVDHSRTYTNPWIAENRFDGKVARYSVGDGLERESHPPTNIVIAATKVEQ